MKKKGLIISLILIIVVLVGVVITTVVLSGKKSEAPVISIPKVYFTGDMSGMVTKKDEKIIQIEYKSDELEFTSYANIKLQGTSSLAFEKKNYDGIYMIEVNNKDSIKKSLEFLKTNF